MTGEEKQREGHRYAKRRHRAIGTGSLYYREDRKRWVAQIILENGKTKQRYCKTQEEAADVLNEMLYEQKRGMLATGPQQTVRQFMEYWLEEVHRPTIRITSYVEYRRILNNHILPALGHVRLQKLTIQQVESFYAQKAKEGLSAKTISDIHGVLRKG